MDKEIQEKKNEVSNYSIFAPKSARILYEDYPELKKHGETFKNLQTVDLLFVWYYACEASPLSEIINPKKRAEESIRVTYDLVKRKKIDSLYREKLVNLRFEDKMKKAIDLMSSFRVGPRLRAKIIAEKAFENLEKMLDIDASDDANFIGANGEVDWTKKKAYMETVSKAITMMPDLINQLESSFSVTEKNKIDNTDEGEDNRSYADEFHDQKK